MKREKLPSRKKRALRRSAVAVLILFCINFFMHIGLLFPIQAIWQLQERGATGWTRVVTRDWVPEIHKTHLVYLTENEDATLLGSTYLTVYGWIPCFGNVLDCSGNEPLYAGAFYMHSDEDRVWYFFGRVDNPDIKTLTISVQADVYNQMSQAYDRREVRQLTTTEFQEKNGHRYFLVRDDGTWDYEKDYSPRPVVIGYNDAGNEVTQADITQGSSSHFG